MELFLNIFQIIGLIIMIAALWQAWRIIKRGKADERLSEKEASGVTRRLTVAQVCLGIETVITVCRVFLPLIFT